MKVYIYLFFIFYNIVNSQLICLPNALQHIKEKFPKNSKCKYIPNVSDYCDVYIETDYNRIEGTDNMIMYISLESPLNHKYNKKKYNDWCTIDGDSLLQLPATFMPYVEDFLQPNPNISRENKIVVVISNCQKDRIQKIQAICELGLPVDVYGSCIIDGCNNIYLNDKHEENWHESKKMIIQKYNFVLAFENSLYHNYVTEKLYDALLTHTIPYYIGAPNVLIDRFAPPDSFISNLDDLILTFNSPILQDYFRSSWRDESFIRENYIRNNNNITDCLNTICEFYL